MVKFMGIKCSLYGTTDEVGRAKTATTCYKIEFDRVKERMDSELKIKQTNSIIFTHTHCNIWIISLSPVAPLASFLLYRPLYMTTDWNYVKVENKLLIDCQRAKHTTKYIDLAGNNHTESNDRKLFILQMTLYICSLSIILSKKAR